jgi:hypothetical protein
VVSVAVVALGLVRIGPWLWVNLFPAVANEGYSDGAPAGLGDAAGAVPTPEQAAEALHRVLANWGAGDAPELDTIYLPQGRRPGELQDTLRGLEALSALEVYVTRVDDLLFRLRIFSGPNLLLQRDVFPWLPERPSVSGVDPPETGFIVVLGEHESDALSEVCSWRAPLAIAVPPFAAHAVKSMRFASRCSKGVLLLLDPEDDLADQLAAAPEASGALIESQLEEGVAAQQWLRPLVGAGVFLLDGRASGSLPSLEKPARKLGIPYVRRSGHLRRDSDLVLARNLTVRRGYGLVSAGTDEDGLSLLKDFIESSRVDGYTLLFPGEVARAHGLEVPEVGMPGRSPLRAP